MATMPMTARSSNRNGTKVIWIACHTSEGTSYGARGLRDAGWWEGSSHAISDDKELLDHNSGCVHPDRAAWTLRNGNPRSVNIEQVAYASWPRETWLNDHMPMLRHTAQWIADMAQRFDIPITYVGIDGVRNRTPGIIQHNDYSKGTGDGTHWDCGPGWPGDVVIDLARDIATPPLPPPVPTPARLLKGDPHFMFFYAQDKNADGVPDSGVRLCTGAFNLDYQFGAKDLAAIDKARLTGGVAPLSLPAWTALFNAGAESGNYTPVK